MPVLPFEQARRKAIHHLETFLASSDKKGNLKPIGEKNALFRAMQKWEHFFPGLSLPVHELFLWLDLVDQSRARDPIAFTTAKTLLEIMKGPYTDPTIPAKEGDPWCHVDLKAKTVKIAGETFPIDHRPTLLILEAISKGTKDSPVPSRQLKKLPYCHHPRQIDRFLKHKRVPIKIRRLIKADGKPGGGRWMIPPWQS